MKRLRLTQEDLADLLAGHTINAMVEDGTEYATSADRPGIMHVAAVGNAFDGLTLYGPFASAEDAVQWAEGNEFTVIALNVPSDPTVEEMTHG